MRVSWVVNTFPYGFHSHAPTSADIKHPIGYIWIVRKEHVAYSLFSIEDNQATWVVRKPDSITTNGKSSQINTIGGSNVHTTKVETQSSQSKETSVDWIRVNADKAHIDTTRFSKNLSERDIDVQKALETLDQATLGGGGAAGYNFIDTIPSVDAAIDATSVTITGKTMRRYGVGSQSPTVTINGNPVTVTQQTGDETVYLFSYPTNLNIGNNIFTIISDNGIVLTKSLNITRNAVAPSCTLSFVQYMKAGAYTISLVSDYPLLSPPTLSASIGSLSTFTGSGKNWAATLTITNQNGSGLFTNVALVGEGGIGHTINSGASYTVDTLAPVIGTASFSRTLWNYENGSMNCTVTMGENTTGFTGMIDLSSFGLSSNYALTPTGNNMIANFTPARVDTPSNTGKNIRVSDRCGNAATPKANTDNQLQVVAYRLPLQNVTFPAYAAMSNILSGGRVFTTDANSIVSWGANQTNSGTLVYGTDYVVIDHNKILLAQPKWSDTLAANALGLLNVNCVEN
jgi:hypothetical protein